jgi:PEGA domain/Protein kinase domain
VFRTYEPTRDRLVAVKVFRLDVTPEQARTLADELRRAAEAGLFQASIVEPVAAGIEGTVAYRAEEYVAAESLDVAMRHYAPATLDKVLPFITQLAAAIDFARSKDVGHGALHPRDIFVTPEEARATGFGVVDALEQVGLRAPVRRPYSPPERIAGEPWGTPADVFSLAVIAFELLTGRRPSGLGEQMGPLTGDTLGARGDEIRKVLARATAEDPEERYPTAQAFASALAKFAPQETAAEAAKAREQKYEELVIARPDVSARDLDIEIQKEADIRASHAEDLPLRTLVGEEAQAPEIVRPPEIVQPEIEGPSEIAQSPEIAPTAEVTPPSAAAREVRKKPARKKAAITPPVADDIAAERESDEAHWLLSREEAEAGAPAADVAAPVTGALFGEASVVPPPVTTPVEADEPPTARDNQDRVVAVDEFKAREAASVRVERARSRAQERIAVAKSLTTETSTPDFPLQEAAAPHEEPASDRPRLIMLPLAVVLILGLLLGFLAGYVVGGREGRVTQTVAQSAPIGTSSPAQPQAAPAQPSAREFSEQAVAPTAGRPPATPPAVPAETALGTPAPAARPPSTVARRGRIEVRSTPSGAGVTVNGRWSGRTPLTIDDLAFRSYAVRIVQPGFVAAREDVTLSAKNASKTISVKLKSQAAPPKAVPPSPTQSRRDTAPTPENATSAKTGVLFVDSRPQGARVLLNGKVMGITPLRVPELPIGSYSVRIELTDHRPWMTTTKVPDGDVARVTGSLERIR